MNISIPPSAKIRGRVMLISRDWILGEMIREVTHSIWTHATLICDTEYTIEAHDLAGVQRIPIQDYETDSAVAAAGIYEVPGLAVEAAMTKASRLTGKPYATADLIRIYLSRGLDVPNLDKKALDSEDRLICSEFVARCLFAGGIDVRPHGIESFGLITPADLDLSSKLRQVWFWQRTDCSTNPVNAAPGF